MPRIFALDRLRLAALLGVVLFHLSPSTVKGGYLGVNIFFSLAGYLTMLAILGKDGEKDGLRYFASSTYAKIKKLYPPLLIMLFISLILTYLVSSSALAENKAVIISSVFSLSNYTQLLSSSDYFANTGLLAPYTHLWAIAMEMQVYILFFALAPIIKKASKSRQGIRKIFLTLIIISLASYLYSIILVITNPNLSRIYYDTFARLYSFSLAALSALLVHISKEKSEPNRIVIAILSMIVILAFIFLKPDYNMFIAGLFIYSSITAVLLFFMSDLENRLLPVADNISQFFAQRSYHIFLWHYPILKLMEKIFSMSKINGIIYTLIFLALLAILSEGSYRFIRALKSTRILGLLSALIAIAVIIAPYEALSGKSTRGDVMKSVIEGESLIKKRQNKQEKEARNFKQASKIKNLRDGKTEGGDKDKKNKPEINLEESPTYELASGFLDEINAAYPELSVSLEDFNRLHLKKFLFIGDSIGSMSYHTLYTYLPFGVYDTDHSRQMDEAPAFLEEYLKTDETPDYIFVQLGTNAGVDKKDLDKLRELAPKSKFFIYSVVLPYKDEEDDRNSAIYSYYEEHKKDGVYLVDWYKHTKELDIFFEDGIHPGEEGAKILAHLMMKAMLEADDNIVD